MIPTPKKARLRIRGGIEIRADVRPDRQEIFRDASIPVSATSGAGAPKFNRADVRKVIGTIADLSIEAQRDTLNFMATLTSAAGPTTLLQRLQFFVPRDMREQLVGDLLEDLADMAAAGCSRREIWLAMASQLVCALLRLLWPRWLRGG